MLTCAGVVANGDGVVCASKPCAGVISSQATTGAPMGVPMTTILSLTAKNRPTDKQMYLKIFDPDILTKKH